MNFYYNALLFILLLPFIGFVVNGLSKKIISKKAAGVISTIAVFIPFCITIILFTRSIHPFSSTLVNYFTWIKVGSLQIDFSFLIDRLSIAMMMIITGIGTLIHIYSIGYMKDDERFHHFFSYLNLFIFFMLILVLGANYPVLFIGWEGVGLCSYLLIGFWFKNQSYNQAANKAFIINRIGDLGFLLGIFLIFQTFGSVNFADVFTKASSLTSNNPTLILITILLFIGATGKSAQIPLYTWLPDAMAGPTPVSALIHAATMVTAGIYMIIRSHILFSLAPTTLSIILLIGLVTALFAATIGLKQNDIKKILAYSTVSQLGYMFIALGLGAYTTAFFHLATHAFFKALLFLGAGSVIHAMSGEQDIMQMGGLRKKIPITFITFLIATLAISGIPPFAGFFSKDEILAKAFEYNPFIWTLAVIGSVLTTFYMFRLLYLVFFGEFRGTVEQKNHLHESPLPMTVPLMILAISSTFAGFIGIPNFISHSHLINHYLHSFDPFASESELSHSTEIILVCCSTGLVILTIFLASFIFLKKKSAIISKEEKGLAKIIKEKYYIDEIYDFLITKPILRLSDFFYKTIDKKGIDRIVNNIGANMQASSSYFRLLQTGNLGTYLFIMVIGIILLVGLKLLL